MPKQFQRVLAVLEPAKEHAATFREEYTEFIGKAFTFQYMYQMESDQLFPGEWCLIPLPNEEGFAASWVPEFDLKIID